MLSAFDKAPMKVVYVTLYQCLIVLFSLHTREDIYSLSEFEGSLNYAHI